MGGNGVINIDASQHDLVGLGLDSLNGTRQPPVQYRPEYLGLALVLELGVRQVVEMTHEPRGHRVPTPARRTHGTDEIDINQIAEFADHFTIIPRTMPIYTVEVTGRRSQVTGHRSRVKGHGSKVKGCRSKVNSTEKG